MEVVPMATYERLELRGFQTMPARSGCIVISGLNYDSKSLGFGRLIVITPVHEQEMYDANSQ